MSSYSRLPLRDLLDEFASSRPVPAGGSAGALAAATGVALLVMVARIQRTRTGSPDPNPELAAAVDRLLPLQSLLTALIDRDAQVYDSVLAAARLPTASAAQSERRTQTFNAAMRDAAETQLDTMRGCSAALDAVMVVAEHGVRSARGDVGMAIELLRAAARGASANVAINLAFIEDERYREEASGERMQLDARVQANAEAGLGMLAHPARPFPGER